MLYHNGLGVPLDRKEAVKWYTLTAVQGVVDAQYILTLSYEDDKNVLQDYKEAAKRYTLAAEQGSAQAQSNLGVMYFNGEGVLADFIIEQMWSNIAAANGNEPAAKNREIIAKKMTSADISIVQAMARVCMNSNYENYLYRSHWAIHTGT